MRLRVLAPTIALSVTLLSALAAAPAFALSCPPANGGTQSCGSETIGSTHVQAWVGPAGGGAVRSVAVHPKAKPKPPVEAASWQQDETPSLAGLGLFGGILVARRKVRRLPSLSAR